MVSSGKCCIISVEIGSFIHFNIDEIIMFLVTNSLQSLKISLASKVIFILH